MLSPPNEFNILIYHEAYKRLIVDFVESVCDTAYVFLCVCLL